MKLSAVVVMKQTTYIFTSYLKGIIDPKIKILLSFAHPYFILNLYVTLDHKISLKMLEYICRIAKNT